MIRTVTLRLEQDAYEELREAAAAEPRSLSNFIVAAALERRRVGRAPDFSRRDGFRDRRSAPD